MIIYFDEGINRVWYKSIGFRIGLSIQLQLWDPDLDKKNLQDFIEFEEGLYYLDYSFNKRGSWIGIAYENGIKTESSTFNVGMRRPGIVRYILRKYDD